MPRPKSRASRHFATLVRKNMQILEMHTRSHSVVVVSYHTTCRNPWPSKQRWPVVTFQTARIQSKQNGQCLPHRCETDDATIWRLRDSKDNRAYLRLPEREVEKVEHNTVTTDIGNITQRIVLRFGETNAAPARVVHSTIDCCVFQVIHLSKHTNSTKMSIATEHTNIYATYVQMRVGTSGHGAEWSVTPFTSFHLLL